MNVGITPWAPTLGQLLYYARDTNTQGAHRLLHLHTLTCTSYVTLQDQIEFFHAVPNVTVILYNYVHNHFILLLCFNVSL